MKLAAIIFLPSLLTLSNGHVIKHQHLRRVPSAVGDVDAAVSSHLAIYNVNNGMVAAQESSLLALQKTWNGSNSDSGSPTGVVAAVASNPTTAVAPVITPSVQVKEPSVVSPAETSPSANLDAASGLGVVKEAAVEHHSSSDSGRYGNGASTAQLPTSATLTTITPVPTTASSTSSVVVSSASSTASSSGFGSTSSGNQYSGPATPEGAQMPNACGITVDTNSEMATAIPQWLFDTGREGQQPSPLCGQTITVIDADGSSHQAKIVDRCGPGGGQDVQYWLDMSYPLYTAVTGNSGAGSTSGEYPTVSWFVNV